jgi:hypothetical protein
MKLVETDAEGPSAEASMVTPPPPEKRRVSISLIFTVSVLVATVVTIYTVFPARDNELLTVALRSHRAPPAWDLTHPDEAALRAWTLAAVGKRAPLPAGLPAEGAALISILRRPTALVRYRLGAVDITYVLQRVHALSPPAAQRVVDGLRAVQWREGDWLVIGVGPEQDDAWLGAAKRR